MNKIGDIETPLQPPNEQLQNIIALYKKGEFDYVIRKTKQLVKQFPNDPILYNFIGVCQTKLNQYKPAIETYKTILKINPVDPDAYFNLGNIFKNCNAFEKAISNYQKALKLNPMDSGAANNMVFAYSTKVITKQLLKSTKWRLR